MALLLVAAGFGAWMVAQGGAGTAEEVEAVLEQHGFTCGDRLIPAGTPDELSAGLVAAEGGKSASAASAVRQRLKTLPAALPLSLRVCSPSGWLLQSGADAVVVALGGVDLAAVRDELRGVEVAVIDAPGLIPVPEGEVAGDPPPAPAPPSAPSAPATAITPTTIPSTAAASPPPPGGGAIDTSRYVTCQMAADTVRTATEAFHATNGSWPAEMSDLVGDWLGELPQQVSISFDPEGDAPPQLAWSSECTGVAGP